MALEPEHAIETYALPTDSEGPVAELPTPVVPGYRIEGELGHGAMGHVYLAHDHRRGRQVALKVTKTGSPDDLANLAQEAELQGQLRHYAVPRVLGVGVLPDGRGYLAQSLVRGARTLDQAVESASWVQVVEWIATAASAIAVAHGRCVIHGDVKPENLLVDERDRLSVIDWGVSRLGECAVEAPARLSPQLEEHAKKHQSWIQGTLAYMPPEQLRGRAGPGSDVYSLALVLCEMLTGAHPLGDLMLDVDRLVAFIGAPQAPAIPDELPGDLSGFLRRCVQDGMDLRPTSVELARVLRRLARSERRRELSGG